MLGAREDVQQYSYIAGGMQNDIAILKKSGSFLIKLKLHFSHDPAIPRIGIYPREITHVHKSLSMYIYRSFIHNQRMLTK